ncbi:MAG: magnesium transporter CorA family protein [Saprospiraceae bacterium]
MIKYYTRHDGKLTELERPQPGCWINISPPFSHAELEEVANEFEVELDFLTDSLDIDERSRYEREEDVRLIVINTPILNEGLEESDAIYITVPIGLILTGDYLITISSYESPVLHLFLNERVRGFDPTNYELFILQIFEQTVYRFLRYLKKLNAKRGLIERELYDSSRNKELRDLLSIEKSLVYFVNSLSSNELLKMKMKRADFLKIRDDEDLTDLFEDIIVDNSQALEMANIYTSILSGTMSAFGSIISNNLNLTIRRLTLITIVLMVPTLVASFFGMNIPLPMQENNRALFYIIVLSILISMLVIWYFRRKRLF